VLLRDFSVQPAQIALTFAMGLATQAFWIHRLGQQQNGFLSAIVTCCGISLLLRSDADTEPERDSRRRRARGRARRGGAAIPPVQAKRGAVPADVCGTALDRLFPGKRFAWRRGCG
jgi:hypothetical protein